MTDLSKQADTLGYSAKVPEIKGKQLLHNQRIGLVQLKNSNFDIDFLYWLMRTETYQKYVAGSATGATVKHTSPTKICSYKFKAPIKKDTQRRIASILSAYDDLIEKNLKRIKLLEELAQRTYEEWFVKFRVNGKQLEVNEETGLPEGWEKVKLNDVYSIKYGKNLSQTEINIKGQYPVYGASGILGFYMKFNYSNKVVLVTSRGNGSGNIHRTHERAFVTNNSFAIIPNEGFEHLKLCFTFEFFKKLNLKSYCSGSAQPQLTNASMNNIDVLLPNINYILKFNDFGDNLIDLSDKLRNQNRLLKESRDILLSRLMSGRIEV